MRPARHAPRGGDPTVSVGDVVTYTDKTGVDRAALVTAVWDGGATDPSLNLVFVSGDPARDDPYGRQVERETSVPHRADQKAPGNYWR